MPATNPHALVGQECNVSLPAVAGHGFSSFRVPAAMAAGAIPVIVQVRVCVCAHMLVNLVDMLTGILLCMSVAARPTLTWLHGCWYMLSMAIQDHCMASPPTWLVMCGAAAAWLPAGPRAHAV
jgi:hypothetical protein